MTRFKSDRLLAKPYKSDVLAKIFEKNSKIVAKKRPACYTVINTEVDYEIQIIQFGKTRSGD